jgi:hypothetical protein
MWYVESLSCNGLIATALERYFVILKSTFFCHTEGVKYKEQAILYAHVLTDKGKENGS